MKLLHEGAGTVVDGLARDGAVIRVHDAVDEAEAQPLRDQSRLGIDHRIEERNVRVICFGGGGVVARDGIVGEGAKRVIVLLGGEVLERPDADMARGHAGEHAAGLHLLAADLFARSDRGEGTGGGYAEGVHRFAHDIFAQHGTEGGTTVAPPGPLGRTSSLQLEVVALTVLGDDFTEQNSPTITQLRHEVGELMTGVSLRDRRGSLRHHIAGEHV